MSSREIKSITVVHDDDTVRTIYGKGKIEEVKTSVRPDDVHERGVRAPERGELKPFTYWQAHIYPNEGESTQRSVEGSSPPDESIPPSQATPEES